MAIVPLELIRMKVMMAIRMRGMLLPPMFNAKTSLGLGHGTFMDQRTVMYDSRKQLKMKVSLSRKIHIIALPQGTFLNARWSEEMSAITPRNPAGRGRGSAVSVIAACTISFVPVYLSPQSVNKIPRLSLPENSSPKRTSQTSSR
jgi:hypothetical protein